MIFKKNLREYDVKITHHAFIRAMQRGVDPDMVEATVRGGKIERFGKNYVKFSKPYKRCLVVCVGEIVGIKITIITIETK
jgi:hypothetical protein